MAVKSKTVKAVSKSAQKAKSTSSPKQKTAGRLKKAASSYTSELLMSYPNCWINLNEECLESPPENSYGFVYIITNVLTGQIYVGKKAFLHRRKVTLSAKARVGTRKRKEVRQVDGKWLNYYGSSKELSADVTKLGKENFRRKVLRFCNNKADLSYWEGYYQFHYNVLFTPSYNKWISLKVFKSRIN